MGPVGVQEMMVIFLVALVLFGPKKLPELGKTIGKAITEFRRAQSELKATFETHMRELEKESESIKEVTRSYTNEISRSAGDIYNHYTGYDNSYYDSGAFGAGTPSTEANPSTVSVPAIQGAESSVSLNEAPVVNGTVARTSASSGSEHSSGHPSGDAASQPAEPESINT
ncbi:MAG: twin-arginine translocase TatA/TatE family subunit [Bryobacteraceae bacterium]|jgi:sec-independent protein translocase protein TatA